MTGERPDPRTPHSYEIRVRGHLGEVMRQAFSDLDAQTCGDDTLLIGALRDQSALHGVLAQVESLALELVEVRRLTSGQSSADRINRSG